MSRKRRPRDVKRALSRTIRSAMAEGLRIMRLELEPSGVIVLVVSDSKATPPPPRKRKRPVLSVVTPIAG